MVQMTRLKAAGILQQKATQAQGEASYAEHLLAQYPSEKWEAEAKHKRRRAKRLWNGYRRLMGLPHLP